MATIDKYNLAASQPFTLNGRDEVNNNLQLTTSTASQQGTITGTVTSGGQPLADAIVKIFDVNNNPIAHSNTGPQGQYNIPEVVKGSYLITACKAGYLTPVAIPVTVSTNSPTTVNIALVVDPNAILNTIFGLVKQEVTLTPIADAVINIFSIVGGQRTVVSTTKTNSSGQYLTPNLANGDYLVDANKTGYFQVESAVLAVTNGQIAPLDLVMVVDSDTNTGTVSGIITDSVTLLPIANASVALYSVVQNIETIIQITKTNTAGRYLFGNVVTGSYIVKALSQITAP